MISTRCIFAFAFFVLMVVIVPNDVAGAPTDGPSERSSSARHSKSKAAQKQKQESCSDSGKNSISKVVKEYRKVKMGEAQVDLWKYVMKHSSDLEKEFRQMLRSTHEQMRAMPEKWSELEKQKMEIIEELIELYNVIKAMCDPSELKKLSEDFEKFIASISTEVFGFSKEPLSEDLLKYRSLKSMKDKNPKLNNAIRHLREFVSLRMPTLKKEFRERFQMVEGKLEKVQNSLVVDPENAKRKEELKNLIEKTRELFEFNNFVNNECQSWLEIEPDNNFEKFIARIEKKLNVALKFVR